MMDENGNTESTGQDTPPTLSELAQILVAFIGIPAALLYPVGFVVFVLQIWMFYPFSFSTAWYASSLIPATVVTGQGVKVLLVPLVTTSMISLLVGRMLIVRYGGRLRQRFVEDKITPCPKWLSVFLDQLLVLGRKLSAVTLSVLTISMTLLTALIIPLSIVALRVR